MPKKEYSWEDGQPPVIAPHSLAKHHILREYVQRYIQVLTAVPGMERLLLTIVDAFAGGGEYIDSRTGLIVPGSPQILIDGVRLAERAANLGRRKALRIDSQHILIEKKKKVADYLEEVLRKRGDAPTDDGPIQLVRGAFQDQLDEIITRIQRRGRARRAIFVLDQYGYTDVPAQLLKSIFVQLPKAEVFLTLAVGWITAYLPTLLSAATKLGIHQDVVRDLQTSGEGAFDTSDPAKRPNLRAVQRLLHNAFTSEVGNRFYTPFFIVSRESNRPYWFLHLANNAKANDVVKSLHWEVENHFEHFGAEGLLMLGFDPAAQPNPSQTSFAFDDGAKVRTHQALMRQLPQRIHSDWRDGVPFGTLFETTCNETPATRALLASSVSDLCIAGELEKRGVDAERRAATTLPHDDDVISIPRQSRLVFP
jgi:three-Cys-motif partner protein